MTPNHTVNFNWKLSKLLVPGTRVVVIGTPTNDLHRFTVNLLQGERPSDISVHFDVRFTQKCVVRNTLSKNGWGHEETTSCRPFPFEMCKQFKIEMLVEQTGTVWLVDGQHYCSYQNRNPSPLCATWIEVLNVRDVLLKIDTSTSCSIPLPICTPNAVNQSDIKFTNILTEPLAIGSRVICTGTPTNCLPWIAVNIGSSDISPCADILVHFNVRMASSKMIWNTRSGGNWGEEISACGDFPFKVGEKFQIEVLVHQTGSVWIVNGKQYCSYQPQQCHCGPLSVKWVQMTGVKEAKVQIKHPAICC